jgi:WD40 repeat protein
MISEQFLRALLRGARKTFPYPKAWAAVSLTRLPVAGITGKHTQLVRPEGLDFTQSGDLMAVSNSEGNAITIYARKTDRDGVYDSTPYCTLADPKCLNFVHDVSFSPCGEVLAAVAREDHSISIFARSKDHANRFEPEPIATLRGDESKVRFPAGISFHPNGKCLAVANRQAFGITLYRIQEKGENFSVDRVPFQTISEDDLVALGIAAPHGIDFTSDGQILMVAHKTFFKTENKGGDSAVTFFRWRSAPEACDPKPCFTYLRGQMNLHSIAAHPSGRYFAVTDEGTNVEIFEWLPEEASARLVDRISIFRCGHSEGTKGATFTRDGKQIVVTTEADQVLCYSNWRRNESRSVSQMLAMARLLPQAFLFDERYGDSRLRDNVARYRSPQQPDSSAQATRTHDDGIA